MDKRICATSRLTWWIFICVSVLCLFVGIIGFLCFGVKESVILVPCAIYLLITSISRLTHAVYIDDEGIECYQFQKIVRFLAWNDVGQVCVVPRYSISVGGSGESLIIIVPDWCDRYTPPASGDSFVLDTKGAVISIDNTKKNRQFIAHVWGEVVDYRYSKH